MMKKVFIAITFVALVACGKSEQQPTPIKTTEKVPMSETDKINAWFEQRYEEELAFSPIELTMMGRKEMFDQIDDMSLKAYQEQLEWRQHTVDQMKQQFDYQLLSHEAQMSFDLWEYRNAIAQDGREFHDLHYFFEQMDGAHSRLPTFLINFHKVASESDMVAYIARIDGISRAIMQLLEQAQHSAEMSVRPPKFAYQIVKDEAKKLIMGKPFDNSDSDAPLFADAKLKIQSLVDTNEITAARGEKLLEQTRTALIGEFQPAYSALITFLDSDIGNTSEEPEGVHALPNGEAFYNYQLRNMTTTDLSADQIHEVGLKEVERLRGEMIKIKDSTGYKGDLQAFFIMLRDGIDDRRFFYPDTDVGRQAYIDDAKAAIDNIKGELPNYFGLLPKADLVVKRVEAFREQPGAAQHYYPSTPDGTRPGIYYAHLSDMKAMPKHGLEVVAYHEGLPGHHMQIAIAQELDSVPTFRRQAQFTAYVEGWALYSEFLAKEMPGTYTDPYSDFGRLGAEIWRAIRLVVDTGLHAKGWSEQQAIDYFAKNSPEPLASIQSEIRRYLVLPGQATAYKIGMLEILRLRKMAQDQLGDKFDIRRFHDAVLGGGALPLSLLEQRIKSWIESTKQGVT